MKKIAVTLLAASVISSIFLFQNCTNETFTSAAPSTDLSLAATTPTTSTSPSTSSTPAAPVTPTPPVSSTASPAPPKCAQNNTITLAYESAGDRFYNSTQASALMVPTVSDMFTADDYNEELTQRTAVAESFHGSDLNPNSWQNCVGGAGCLSPPIGDPSERSFRIDSSVNSITGFQHLWITGTVQTASIQLIKDNVWVHLSGSVSVKTVQNASWVFLVGGSNVSSFSNVSWVVMTPEVAKRYIGKTICASNVGILR